MLCRRLLQNIKEFIIQWLSQILRGSLRLSSNFVSRYSSIYVHLLIFLERTFDRSPRISFRFLQTGYFFISQNIFQFLGRLRQINQHVPSVSFKSSVV